MRRIALALLGLVLLVLLGAQLLLPGLAERRLREELAARGDVRSVDVRALPALTLLAGRADRVDVRFGAMRAGPADLGALIERTTGAERVDARADTLQAGGFSLRDVVLLKRGDALEGRAVLSDAALGAALPPGVGFTPVPSADGQLVLEATAGLLGVQTTVRARLSAQGGALVVAPDGLLGGLATLTVFRDPRVAVTGVGAQRTADGYALTATGRPAG